MSGKIDKVYEEMQQMEERFKRLEQDQQNHFQTALDKAAASILAEVRKEFFNLLSEIKKCPCNREILDAIGKANAIPTASSSKDKGKEVVATTPKKTGKGSGWYPENLVLSVNPFTGEKL